MNNIHRVENYGNLPAIGRQSPGGGPEKGQNTAPSRGREDQVQISKIAMYLSKIASMPEIRAEKVEDIRKALAEGTYDMDGKLPAALEKLLEENMI